MSQQPDQIAGTTIRPTFVSSGVMASLIGHRLIDGSETVVNSVAATSSGNGHYYANVTLPTTPGWYVSEWRAWVNSFEHIRRDTFRATTQEVD